MAPQRKIFVPDAASLPKTADVVVIGGGIVGVATAFGLSEAGLDTVLVEMREGLSTLTTPLSIESFRAQMTEKAMAYLVVPSIRIYETFAETVGIPGHDIALKHQGYLFVSDVPSAELALLSNTEVMLAPFWVWLLLGETASAGTFVGGAVLLAAILFNA